MMISYGRWICILLVISIFAPANLKAHEIEFYRTLETIYPSGKSEITSLNRTTLSKKTQVWLQIEWEPSFGTLQQGWIAQQDLGTALAQSWRLTAAKKTFLHALPILQSPTVATLEKLTPVKVLGEHQTQWSLSFQKSHGFVWWVDQEELKVYQAPAISNINPLTTADIFKRRLFDLAAHPQDENFQVASSQGIYISRDGKLWSPVARFAKSNLPVAFSPKGTLFIGDYRSQDDGRTFEPILKWDKVASQVINTTRKSPTLLRILELETQYDSVVMTIGIGKAHGKNLTLKLISQDDGTNWEVLRTTPASPVELHL